MKKVATLSLSLGIFSVLLNIISVGYIVPIITMIVGASAIICGIVCFKEYYKFGYSGIICGVCGILLATMWMYLVIIA